jgi:ribosomal protein S18 acetylase RimI-like enzyme
MDIRRIIREELQKVLNPPPEVIEMDWDEGSIFGIVHFDREHLNNWVALERIQPNFDTIPDDKLFPIGILKNINVNEEYRGQGFGVDLMENFLTECSHCQYVVLIADLGEEQREDFNLIDWYKSFGFTIFGESGGNPVMIKKVGALEEIDISVNNTSRAKPGIVTKFPDKEEGGDSLNLSVSDGPHEFPDEEDLK